MSLPKELPTEPELQMEGEEMPTLCHGVDANDLSEVPNGKENTGATVSDVERDTFKAKASSGDMAEQLTESASLVKQPVLTSAASVESEKSGETKHAPTDKSDVFLQKETVCSLFPLSKTSTGNDAPAEPSDFTVNSATETEPSSLLATTHSSGESSKAQDVAGSSIVVAHARDLKENSSLPSAPSTHDTDASASLTLSSGVTEKSVGGEGPPLLQVESPPPLMTKVQVVEAKKNVATTQKRPGSTGVTRQAQAPPVLQPEVITIDDDEPMCDFEEPPLLLPEVAMTRKRKGIVRKRSFYGDTIDSSILKESILEGSPAKRAHKSGMTSVVKPKLSAQTAFTSRLKDDGVTVLISRCGKNGGDVVVAKPKTPTKSGRDAAHGDRKRPEDQSARPRLLNRQPLEKKAPHVVLSIQANVSTKTEQKTNVNVTRDKPFCRRMGSGPQPSRRSGAARYRMSSVRGQGSFANVTPDHRITSTGWRSVPPVSLGDVSTHCGYAEISGRAREVFAPVPPPPGNLVALPRDPELAERMQKVTDGDEPDPDGVFISIALEGFLEEKAPLKLSFPVPDCLMRREKLWDEDPEYQPPAQPTPTLVRPQGERRFKTLLEKQVWLGIRDEKELKAARSLPSPSKDALSSDALPLYSLLRPPRYLTPSRSSRDLSVHRARHLLPLCKVMHKSLDMRRAWDEPAKGADCVQFIYDRHHQVRIRGSGSLSDGPTTRAYGKLLRSEAVKVKLNAWRQNDFRVSSEVVSRQQALLVAAAVQAPPTPASDEVSARQQSSLTPRSSASARTPRSSARTPRPSPLAVRHSSRTPRPRRRLVLDHHETEKKTHPPSSADLTLPATEEKKDSIFLEQEKHAASKEEDSAADQEESSTADKQDSITEQMECSVTDQLIDEVEQRDDVDVTEDTVAHQKKDVADEEVDAAHQKEDNVASERENVANKTDQMGVDTQQEGDPDLSILNQVEDDGVKEQGGDATDEEEVSNHEELKHSSPEDDAIPDRQEDGVADHQEDGVADHQEDDVTDHQEDGVADHQEDGVADHQEDDIADHQEDDVADHHEDGVTEHQEDGIAVHQEDDVADHQEDDVADHQEDDVAVHQEDGIADHQEDGVADHQEDDVAVHQEDDVADHQEDDVADHQEDVIAVHQEEDVADHQEDDVADHQEDDVADHQENGVADHQEDGVADHQEDDIADHQEDDVADHQEDVIAVHQEEDVADHQEDDVADHQEDVIAVHQEEDVADHQEDDVADHHEDGVADHQEDDVADHQEDDVGDDQEDDVADHQEDVIAVHQEDGIADHQEDDVADHQEDGVADHQEDDVADHQEDDIADHQEDDVADHQEDDVADHQEDDVADHQEDDVADHQEDDIADHQEDGVADHQEDDIADHQEDDVADHQEDGVADHQEDDIADHQEDDVADHHEDGVTEHQEDVIAVHQEDGVADHQEDDVGDDQEDDVGDHQEDDVADHQEDDIADHQEDDVADHQEDDIADHQEDDIADHQEDDIADHQEDDVADHQEDDVADHQEDDVADHQEDDVADHQEDDVADHQEDDVADHQEDMGPDRKKTYLDARQDNKMSECRESHLDQRKDNVTCCKKDDAVDVHGDHVDDITDQQKGCIPDQQENKLTDQKADSFADELTAATADHTHAFKHAVNEIAHSNESSKSEDKKVVSGEVKKEETDVSCQPTRAVCEPALQRSNSREAEAQACLGPDTLEDVNAVVGIDPKNEDVSGNGECEKVVDAKTSQKMDTSEITWSVVQSSEGAVTDISRRQSVDARPVAHLAFFKTLLEGSIRPRVVCTATTKQFQVTDGVSSGEVGAHMEAVGPGDPVVNTENAAVATAENAVEAEASVGSSLNSTQAVETVEHVKSEDQSQNPTLELPVKIESSSGEAETCEKSMEIKEKCVSGEDVESCEKPPGAIRPKLETTASDCATQNTAENIDAKDDDCESSPIGSNQTPSATVTGTAPKSEPLSVAESSSGPVVVRRACVHLPRFHLTAVRPYCIFHEVYDCAEYHPGGSCYMAPVRQRIVQLERNLAIRTGRLPPLPARHQHTARTFGRVRPKVARPRPVADSCVAVLPVPDGSPLPPVRAPAAPRRLPLPDNVRISQVREVVLLTPVRSTDGSSCHGLQLRGGALVRVGPGSIRAGVPWRMQPADNVIITAADGRCFRNAADRGCTAAVDVLGSAAELVHFPLEEVNRSLTEGRMALTTGSDGGLTLMPVRMRVMCRDRLRRVAVGQRGRRELFGTGSVVVMDNAGQLTVIGAVTPRTPPGDGVESDSKVEGASQPVGDGSGGGSKRSVTAPPAAAANDDSDVPEVVGTVQGGVRERQQMTGHKRTPDGDANPTGKKRQRVPAEHRVGLAVPRSNGADAQRKAALALSQPRNRNGKFVTAAKRAAKSPDDANTGTKDADKTSAKAVKVVVVPTKRGGNMCTAVPSASKTELSSPLTPSWVMNRLHSVTVEILQADDKPTVSKRPPEPTVNHVATGSKGNPGKRLSATGVLMSVVQKIARANTNPVKNPASANKSSSKPSTVDNGMTSPEAFQHAGLQLPKSTRLMPMSDANGEAGRRVKLGAPSGPPSTESVSKAGGNLARPRSLLKRSFIEESSAVLATPASAARSPRSHTAQRPVQGPRRKRPAGSHETTLLVCNPSRPKVRRKSWADLSAARRSWTEAGAEQAVVPRRRSWDNPAARKSWKDPRDDLSRVRRKSENPQDGSQRRLAAGQAASRRRSGELQPTRPDSTEQTEPPRQEPAAPLSVAGSRPPPTLLRCDGVPVRGRSVAAPEPVSAAPIVDLTTPDKAPPTEPPAVAEVALTPMARRRLKLPLEVTLLNESDMSDDGLDDLVELNVALPADVMSKGVYCPNIEMIEL